ncbi:MAG: endolytic transglycosylase MltG [Chloroflexota bacterium]|nr:MAG: endolytic transglycosylase MltG [Chloroflexota bacterium]
MKLVAIALIAVIFVLAGGTALFVTAWNARSRQAVPILSSVRAFVGDDDSAAGDDSRPRRFVVAPGENATTIAENLGKAGLVRDALAFRLQARNEGLDASFEAGEYQIAPSMRPSEIRQLLQRGRSPSLKITIPEGFRLAQIADVFESARPGTRTAFLAAASRRVSRSFLSDLPTGATLEGYLFPDTYEFTRDVSPTDAVDRLLDTFERRVTPEIVGRARGRGLTVHQLVTLASIVEREAQAASERPLIAAVFLARLRQNMPLQADPTVQYAVQPGPDPAPTGAYWKRDLSAADLATDSPYNTYRVRGLPPGPIANPGLASITAVVDAPSTDLLYFVARPDGTHLFARTLAEHNTNVARARSETR